MRILFHQLAVTEHRVLCLFFRMLFHYHMTFPFQNAVTSTSPGGCSSNCKHTTFIFQNAVPSTSLSRLLQRLYPYDAMLGKEGQTAVTDALKVTICKTKSYLLAFYLVHFKVEYDIAKLNGMLRLVALV